MSKWTNEIEAIRKFGNDIKEQGDISDISYPKEGTDTGVSQIRIVWILSKF